MEANVANLGIFSLPKQTSAHFSPLLKLPMQKSEAYMFPIPFQYTIYGLHNEVSIVLLSLLVLNVY